MGNLTFEKLQEMHSNKSAWVSVKVMNDDKTDILFEFKVKRWLPFTEIAEFIKTVWGAKFTGDIHVPETFAALYDVRLVKQYTDLPLGENVLENYEIIHNFGIVELVLEVIGQTEQYAWVQDCIAGRQNYDMSQRTGIDKLVNYVIEFVDNLNAATTSDEIKGILQELKGLSTKQLTALIDATGLGNLLSNPRGFLSDIALRLFNDSQEDMLTIDGDNVVSLYGDGVEVDAEKK